MRNKVFISYAHADQEDIDWMKKLKRHLGFFERQNLLEIWDDSKLKIGGNPKQEIIEALKDSKIVILLVGPSFLGSRFISEIELPRILEASRVDGVEIFPLITGHCPYFKSDLKDLKSFNSLDKPLESILPHEQNYILNSFCNLLEEVYQKKNDQVLLTSPTSTLKAGFQKIELHNNRITCCCFTLTKNEAFCSGFEPEILKLNFDDQILEGLKSVNSISRTIFRFPGSSVFLIGFDNGEVYSFYSNFLSLKKVFSCKSSVFSITFNSIRKTIITSEKSGEVNEWEIDNILGVIDEDEEPNFKFLKQHVKHSSNAFMFSYNQNQNYGISVSADGTTASIDFKTGKIKIDSLYRNYSLYSVSISENGTIAIGASQGKVFLIDSHFKRKEIVAHTDTVRTLALSPKAKWLFTGSKDKTVKVRNLITNNTWIIYSHKDYIYDIKLSIEYNQLLICDGSGTIVLVSFNKSLEEMNDTDMDSFINQNRIK